ADGLGAGPGGRSAARQGGRRSTAAPLVDQGGRGELARFVRQVTVRDGDRPLAGDVLARRGVLPGRLDVPLPGGTGVVREPVPRGRVRPRGPGVVPLGSVDGRTRHGPGSGGRRIGARGGRGGDRDLRRHIAVAGRGERGLHGV